MMENKAKTYVYSYRLTYFGGTAPCSDGDYLSLAICKRDMRRVIGERKKGTNDRYWVIGIAGAGLQRANSDFTREQIVYIAKIDKTCSYRDYFGDEKNKRADKIYVECKNQKGKHYIDNGMMFKHYGGHVHKRVDLQDRDWDITHQKDDAKKRYVLIADEFAYLSEKDSEEIRQCPMGTGKVDDLLAKGVGHRWFVCENEEGAELLKRLERLVRTPNHGKGNVPLSVQQGTCGDCGKDKAV